MSNRSYNVTGVPAFGSPGASVNIRDEFAAVAAGFTEIEREIDAKVFAATAPSEWVNPARITTFISATQFRWAGADATGIMLPSRRVRCTVNGNYVYSEVMSAVYASGITTVNLYDPILTADLTLVEYGLATPLDQSTSSISTKALNALIDAKVAAGVPFTDVGGSGEKCTLGVRFLGLDDGGNKIFAVELTPVP